MKNIEYPANIFKDRRVKQLIYATLISIALIGLLIFWSIRTEPLIGKYFVELLFGSKYSAGLWTLISAVIFSPVAFILWYFRDQNQQLQIENHRKDINLKDFQKLCEWASGLHLVEDKVTVNQKTSAQINETSETIEQSRPPANSSGDTTSRRDGSIGLQIAAVYQLRAFIEGTHGEYFVRPALILILALWEKLMYKHYQAYLEIKNLEPFHDIDDKYKQIQIALEYTEKLRTDIFNSGKSLFAQSLSEILLIDNGKRVASQKRILVNKQLIGLLPYANHGIELEWQKVDLSFSNLFYFYFGRAKLYDCNFFQSNIIRCQIYNTHFKNCKFKEARLKNCDFIHDGLSNINTFTDCELNFSIMENSKFCLVKFYGGSINTLGFLNNCFVGCTFKNINLQFDSGIGGLSFENSKFSNLVFDVESRSTKFYGCIFDNVNFKNIIINGLFDNKTKFENCEVSPGANIQVHVGRDEVVNEFRFGVLPIQTHALRLRLRDTNGLVLNSESYTEYESQWNQLSEVE